MNYTNRESEAAKARDQEGPSSPPGVAVLASSQPNKRIRFRTAVMALNCLHED